MAQNCQPSFEECLCSIDMYNLIDEIEVADDISKNLHREIVAIERQIIENNSEVTNELRNLLREKNAEWFAKNEFVVELLKKLSMLQQKERHQKRRYVLVLQ